MESFDPSKLKYMAGFGNHFETEVIQGVVPQGQNSPQKCPFGLYAEQYTGTPFTYARFRNQRTWAYRIQPACNHLPFVEMDQEKFNKWISNFETSDKRLHVSPSQLRWKPMSLPNKDAKVTFFEGITTYCGAGSPFVKTGLAIHLYSCNAPMEKQAFYNSDGDFLIIPQDGALLIKTEFGIMKIEPQELAVVQRGIRFTVDPIQGHSKGYICEVFKGHFVIPDLGPIGANCMANPRDFETPVAWYEEKQEDWTVFTKFGGKFFQCKYDHSPFDVVGWHGNYAPYKYDLRKYNTIGSISFDHPDPSIFTCLTCGTDDPGCATCDFVLFPPRWLVQENTFRPPWYHHNTMTEFMGNIVGTYDARENGFCPGSASLHSCMTAHGPESMVFDKWSNTDPKLPMKVMEGSMCFMFETCFMFMLSDYAVNKENYDNEYNKIWDGLGKHFDKNNK